MLRKTLITVFGGGLCLFGLALVILPGPAWSCLVTPAYRSGDLESGIPLGQGLAKEESTTDDAKCKLARWQDSRLAL